MYHDPDEVDAEDMLLVEDAECLCPLWGREVFGSGRRKALVLRL